MPPTLSLACRELSTEQDFHRLRPTWEALYRDCTFPTPFCTWEWAWHWWRCFGAPDSLGLRLLIVMVSEGDGTLAGLAPFVYPTRPGLALRLRPLRPLGTRIRCRSEDMTDEPILLLRGGREEAALGAILDHLARRRDAPWDLTHVQAVRRAEGAEMTGLWAAARPAAGPCGASLRSLAGQIVPLPDSWPAFRRSLSRSMRDNLPYYPRLLSRHGHEWAIHTARTPAEVEDAATVLIRLHHTRAQSLVGARHEDHLPAARHERFLRETLSDLAAQSRASVVWLEVGGVPVAAQAILESDSMVVFYYSGFDPAWHAYSPITILNAHVLEGAIARGVPLANYLPGAEPWKARWGATALFVLDEVSWIRLRPRPVAGSLRRSLIRARQRLLGDSCECGFCGLPMGDEGAPGGEDMLGKRRKSAAEGLVALNAPDVAGILPDRPVAGKLARPRDI